jgi:uncharacterized protein with ParB-like and HNH nuclease domain
MATSNLETLSELFNEKIFRIPDYQRGYSWNNTQLQDFWLDLNNLRTNRIHYTGMITVENKGDFYHIIDGQQRLTTLMILIKTILDYFNDDDWIGDYEKKDYVKKFLYKKIGKEEKNIRVIFGYEKDNPSDIYYKTKILDLDDSEFDKVPEDTLYTRNLLQARQYFNEKVKVKYVKNDSVDKIGLENLFQKVIKNLKFNFYELDDELDEFVTFETMNNRGKPLTTLELLKNRLIYLTTLLDGEHDEEEISTLRNDINNAWKTMYEYLGKNFKKPINDDKFLKDHWIMYFTYDRSVADVEKDFLLNKHFTQNRATFKYSEQFPEFEAIIKKMYPKDWEKELKKHYINYNNIKDYVFNIQKAVREYYYMENPESSSYSEDIKQYLSKLNRVGFGAFRPLIMSVMIEKENFEKHSKEVIKILKYAEQYVFLVFNVSGRRSNTGDSKFYKFASQYSHNKYIHRLIDNIEGEIFNENNEYRWVDINKFVDLINDKTSEGFYSWKGLKYFLYEYELYMQDELHGQRKLQWEEINKDSIEHVYPQTANKDCWKEAFQDISNKEKQKLLHSLGNLLLLSSKKNSTIQNSCFEQKKEYFSNGSYSEIEVSKNINWTPKSIKERSIKLLEFLSYRWEIIIEEEQALKLI